MSREVGGHACRGLLESKGAAAVLPGAGYLRRLLWPSGSDAWSAAAAARARQHDQRCGGSLSALLCSQLAVQTLHQTQQSQVELDLVSLAQRLELGTIMIERVQKRHYLGASSRRCQCRKINKRGGRSAFGAVRHERLFPESCHQGRSGSV